MESLPFFITYLYLFVVASGVVIGFVISLPIVIIGAVMLILQKRSLNKNNRVKSRIPIMIIVIGALMFFVMGDHILHFLKAVL